MICRHITTHEWVVGWVSGSMGGVRLNDYKNLINLDLMDIILFEDL